MNNLNNRLKNTTLTNEQQSKLQMKFKVENEMIKIENKNKKIDKKMGENEQRKWKGKGTMLP
jgi:hypothetical protein